jgi:hypothetical protein
MENITFRSKHLGLVAVTLPDYCVGYFWMDVPKTDSEPDRVAIVVVFKRADFETTYDARNWALLEMGKKREEFIPCANLETGYQKNGPLTLYAFGMFKRHENGVSFIDTQSTPDLCGKAIVSAETLIKEHLGIDIIAARKKLADRAAKEAAAREERAEEAHQARQDKV